MNSGAAVTIGPAFWVVLALLCAAAAALAALSGLRMSRGVVTASVRAIVQLTATSLAGRRAMEDLRVRRGEFEALLALGFPDPDAVRELCRPYAGQALHPALDQTRTVGLVTLPGAFVGVLLGGGSPVQAGAAQLLVLIGLLAAETIAIVVVLELIARGVINRPAVA
ncbi:ABC transporter permease [Catellatospora chokoriensis]|uniref:ABC transport system permease protein n=1 Tax=Catellatospora chokoriensis TaxID=310353 RepID=A0A8J3NUE7_9ACTN|nr:ABC transporter permease [Catellatospora chokoriensis]GIF92967.1 hypothetical protein Cch02nite_64110 [Catellatospora chokoriensis]